MIQYQAVADDRYADPDGVIQTAAEIVRSCNVRRRQLSTVELARLANVEATRDAWRPNKVRINADLPSTQAEAAAKWGVAVRTIQQVRAIDESSEEDLKEALTIRRAESPATGLEPF